MDKLAQTKRFIKYQRGDFKENDLSDLEDYIRKQIKFVEEDVYAKITERVNWLLDRVRTDGLEIVPEGNVIGDNGNWRLIVSGTNLEIQKRLSGTWTKKAGATSST